MITSRTEFLVALTVLLAPSAYAQTGIDASVVSADAQGVYHVESQCFVEASSKTAWEVLSDYGHIDEFVASMRRSEIRERGEHGLLLEQEWVTGALFFVRTFYVLLETREEPETSILFRDLSGKDFEVYEGSWRIEPSTQGVWIRYELRAKPLFSLPGFIAKQMLIKTAKVLLGEVRLEILRRNQSTG